MKKNNPARKSNVFARKTILAIAVLIGFVQFSNAQLVKPFTQRASSYTPTKKIYNIKGDFVMFGNTNLTLAPSVSDRSSDNSNPMVYVDVDNDVNTLNSSLATLSLSTENGAIPSCSNIIYAGLYWTGRAHDGNSPNIFTVTKSVPGNVGSPVNQDYTVGNGGTINYTNYTMNISRQGSSNNYIVRYTFTSSLSGNPTVDFEFENTPNIRYRINSGSWVNAVNQSFSSIVNNLRTATFNPVTVYSASGGVTLTVKNLVRDVRTNQTSTTYRASGTALVNVTGTYYAPVTVTKNFNKQVVSLKGPGATSYTTITAGSSDIYYPTLSSDVGNSMFSAYAEITDYVKAHGIGDYTVADIAIQEGSGGFIGYYGGWGMVVVYENSKMKWRDLTIFDGHAFVREGIDNYEIPVNNFRAVQNGDVNLKLGVMAGEGDLSITGDYLKIQQLQTANWVTLSHYGTTANNFFNSSINTEGNFRNPFITNNTGLDIATFSVPNPSNSIINNNQTSTKFQYGSSQDTYIIFCLGFGVDAYVPEVEAVNAVLSIDGIPVNTSSISVLPGQIMSYNLKIYNKGTEAVNNEKIIIPIPYTASLQPGYNSSVNFSPAVNNLTYDPTIGATGSLVWDIGNLPVPTNPDDLLAELNYDLKVTTDCFILSNPNCVPQVTVDGAITGVGGTSGFNLDQTFISGYQQTGTCIGEPIRTPIAVTIDRDAYVAAHCQGTPTIKDFAFCNYSGTTIPITDVLGGFPKGSRFYKDETKTIEYTIDNPFPATLGTISYIAVPPGITTCLFDFTITVKSISTVPSVINKSYCLNEVAVPLVATPSVSGYNLYFYTTPTGGTPQTSITPSTAVAGNTTYYVAEGESGSCISPNRNSLIITVNSAISATLSGGTTPICYNMAPGTFTATGTGGTGSYTYLWYKNGTSTGITTQTYAPGNLTATSSFYCAVTSGSCGTVNTSTTTITVNGNLTATLSGGTTPICYNMAPGTFTATGTGGTGSYTYLWYKNGTSTGITTQTYAPGNLTATSSFYCAVTSGSCGTVNTSTTTITVNALPTISGNTTVCIGSTIALTGSGIPSGTIPWFSGDESIASVTSSGIVSGVSEGPAIIYYTNSNGCVTSTTINVNPLPTITIAAPATCAANLLTYSVQVNVSSGSLVSTSGITTHSGNLWTISSIPAGINITLTLTDGNNCSETLDVTAPDCSCPVVSAPGSGGDKDYCAGSPIPGISGTVQTGETIDWYVNSTGGSAVATGTINYLPASPGTYYAEARNTTTNCISSTRTAIKVTSYPVPVSGTLTPSVPVGAVCSGTSISATATPGSGGAGTIADVLQYRYDGGAWNSYTSGTSLTTSGHSSVTIQTYRTATGSGCTQSVANTVSWTINPMPVAGILTPLVATGAVCSDAIVSASLASGSGGAGTVTDVLEYRYDGGLWSVYTSGSGLTTSGHTSVDIHTYRTASGPGCTQSSENIVSWTINPTPVSGTLTPSVAAGAVCAGTTVSASLTPGTEGVGSINDVLQYRYDGGIWIAYASGASLNTAGHTSVDIQTYRTASGPGCTQSDPNIVNWIINPVPVAGTLNPTVPAGAVCSSTSLSATLTPGSGGAGVITDVMEYRYDGGPWLTYTSGSSLIATGHTSVDIRTYRTATGSGCTQSASNTVSWTMNPAPVAGTLTPSVPTGEICSSASVSATLTPGSGGAGTIVDVLQYRYDGGSWVTYLSGSNLTTAGHTSIDIQTYRTATGSGCTQSATEMISWTINPVPVAGTLTPSVPVGTICSGTSVSVELTQGTGGAGTISDVLEYRFDDGLWTAYTSGTDLIIFGHTSLDVRTYRTASGPGCTQSATKTVSWIINPVPVAGTLTPAVPAGEVCVGTSLSATLTPGTGGAGIITDILQYRYDGGLWSVYTSESILTTTGHTSVDIKTYRTSSGSGCTQSTENMVSWTIKPVPVSGTLTPSVTASSVCSGTTVFATLTPGSGGAGTTADVLQYRYDGGTWTTYSSGTSLTTEGHTSVEIQTYRTATGSGCSQSAANTLSWIINPIPVAGTLTPSVPAGAVCSAATVSAILTLGSGGAGIIADVLQYRYDGGSWAAYTSGSSLLTAGHTSVDIQTFRTATGSGCTQSSENMVSWTINPVPVAGTLTPSVATGAVCSGTNVSAELTPGSGGVGTINDVLQFRFDGGTWTSYTSGTLLSTAGHTSVQIQTYRTATGPGCTQSAANEISWTINPVPVAGILTPSVPAGDVCSSISVSATLTAGSGGAGTISDVLEYRFDTGPWIAYTSGSSLATAGHTTIDIQTYRTATGSGCEQSDVNTVSWTINPIPVAGTLTPSVPLGEVCSETIVSAILTAGSGGAGTITDVLQYRFDGGSWLAYISGSDLVTTGHTSVDIRTFRTSSASGCTQSTVKVISWTVIELPLAPVVSDAAPNNSCPQKTIDLSDLVTSTMPLDGEILYKTTDDPYGVDVPKPTAAVAGTYYIFYKNANDCYSASTEVVVTIGNCGPIAKDDALITLKDISVSGNVLTNDSDPEGDDLVINTSPIVSPSNGSVVINLDGTFTYTPNNGFSGNDSFVYEVCDDRMPSLCNEATVTIKVIDLLPSGNPPVANNDIYQGSFNLPVHGNVLSNDFDPDGDLILTSVTLISPAPGNGALTLNSDGTFVFVPDDGFLGQVSFSYQICDSGTPVQCSTAMVTIDILPNPTENSTFVMDDIFFVKEDQVLNANLLENDFDPEGDVQIVNTVPVSGPSHGTLSVNADGSFMYTPAPNYSGTDQFVYKVCDNGTPTACNQGTVYLLIGPANDPPVAKNDVLNTFKDIPVSGNLLTNDRDPEGDELVINTSPTTPPSNGSVVINLDGTFTYTPNNGFSGSDSFGYDVCDDGTPSLCDEAAVTIEVLDLLPSGNPPVANNDDYQGSVNLPVHGNVTSNDFDPDDDLNTTSVAIVGGAPGNGSLTLNPDGTFVFVPTNGFLGEVSFSYQVCDLGNPVQCSTAIVTIAILPNPTENSTFVMDDIFFGPEDQVLTANVLANDFDPEGDIQTIIPVPVSAPLHGTLVLNSNGSFTYTPELNYSGTDQFIYKVCDNGIPTACAQGTVYLLIGPANDQPVAKNDVFNTFKDVAVSGNLLTNDSDPENDILIAKTNPISSPSNGSVAINTDGTFIYTPNSGFSGTDSFVYEVCDDGVPSLCDQATVTIRVIDLLPADNPPVANNDNYQGSINLPVHGNVISNDFDPDGDLNSNSVTLIGSAPGHGSLTLNSDGTFVFVPDNGFLGQVSFSYQVCDAGTPVQCATALVTIEILLNPAGNSTFAVDDIFFGKEDLVIYASVLDNDFDPEGDTQTVNTVTLSGPSHGSLTLNSNGSFSYTPGVNFSGIDQFVYKVCDNGTPTACAQATVTLLVAPVNHFPIANDDTNSTLEDQPIVGANAAANDVASTDGENVWSLVGENGGALNGQVTMNADGTYNYTPNPNFNGSDSFTYQLCDKEMDCSTAVVSITVVPVNDTPFAFDDFYTTSEDVPLIALNAAENDYPSGDGGNLWSLDGSNGGATNGVVAINDDGTFNYIPNSNFHGSDSFSYKLCDINNDCSFGRVNITVIEANDKPVANNDVASTVEDVPIVGGTVTGNDVLSGDGGNVWSLVGENGGALNGTVTMYPNGTYDYYPETNFNGTDVFVYQICDIDGDCEPARVTINIDPVGDVPSANDDEISTFEETAIIGASVVENDHPSGDGGNVWSLFGTNGGALHGKVVMTTDGTFNYYPDNNYSGNDTFIYLVCDVENDCSAALVDITILPLNDPPVAEDDINTTFVNIPVDGNILTNDSDPDGDSLTLNTDPVEAPSHGTVIINPDGSYRYTPNEGFSGTDSFIYEICDSADPSLCDQAKVTIKIIDLTSENNAPVAVNDSYQGSENSPVTGNVLSNDFDPDGNLNMNSVSVLGLDPAHGTFTMMPNGNFTFNPEPDFMGSVSFEYRVCDLGTPALCDVATVTIEILANPEKNSTFATDDEFYGNEDTPLSGNVLSNDNDPQGDTQTVNTIPLVQPEYGELTLNADGSFTYVPSPNFIGTDRFVYEVCDSGTPKACDQATVYLIIGNKNDPPIATDDINTTFKDMAVSGNLLINDSDPEGDLLTAGTIPVNQPANGTVEINPDGSYTYLPNEGYSGTDSFTYQVCDDGSPTQCDQATVTINVLDLHIDKNPPVATNDAYQGSINIAVSGNVLSNDFDPDDDLNSNSVTLIGSAPGNGTLALDPTGTFIFTPEHDFYGQVSFTYQVCDLGTPALCDEATVTIEIIADQDRNLTVATDDSYFGMEETVLSGNVLDNDYDPQGDKQTISDAPVVAPLHGSLILNVDGTFEYVPVPNFVGHDEFVYEVCDNGTPGACDRASVHLIVGNENDPPVAQDDINITFTDRSVGGNLLTNDSDPEGNLMTVNTTPVTPPANGSVVINPDGSYLYTPNTDYSGTDTFVYEICDDGIPVLCDQATVTIRIIDLKITNNEPVAINDIYQGSINLPVNGNVLGNDFDPDGDLDMNSVSLIGSAPSSGILTLNTNGTFSYIPVPGFLGQVSFTYRVCDLGNPVRCAEAKVTIEILANPKGNSTFATDDSYFVWEDMELAGNVLTNDNDPEGDIQTVNPIPVVSPVHGTVTLNADGTFSYLPATNFVGHDQFVYEVCDNGKPKACDQGTVHIIVGSQNDPPVAKDDINTTLKDIPVGGNLLTNDSDPEGDLLTVNTSPVILPAHGTVTINSDGTYSYTPSEGYFGNDSFVYQVCDNGSPVLCSEATVTIKIIDLLESHNPPVANNDAYLGSVNLQVKGNVISNDFDPDGDLDPSSIVLQGAAPLNGSLILNPDGTFTFTPDPEFYGQVSFTYQVCDLGTPVLCDHATVTIEIRADHGENSTVATDDSYFGWQEVQVTGNVLNNDYDPQGDTQTVNSVPLVQPLHGTVILNTNGTFTYMPEFDYIGNDEFVYEVCDNGFPVACTRATVHFLIAPVDHYPVAVNDVSSTSEDYPVSGNVAANDTPSRDGENSWSVTVQPENGTVSMNPDGSYTYTPDPDFNGTDIFGYQLCDGDGDCVEATVTITVNPENDVPIAANDEITLYLDGVLNESVAGNDVPSGDGGNVWTVVSQPANGNLIFSMDGSYTYTPALNFDGTDVFTYEICDANGDCSQATVSITMVDVVLPNQVFTPNNDGQNDHFFINGIEFYPGNRLTVFNRWGNVVYEKTGYLNDWDGYSNVKKIGKNSLPVGTYYYVLDYGNKKHKTGYVYLDR